MLGQTGIAARTDYIVNGRRDAFVFLTAAKKNGREGRPLCARTTDGGLTWTLASLHRRRTGLGFAIMPSSVRVSRRNCLLSAFRVHQDAEHDWIDLYRSDDNGAHWEYLARPVPSTGGHGGNPPSMIRLHDGRLCLTYGFREAPHEIRAQTQRRRQGVERRYRPPPGLTWELGYTRDGPAARWQGRHGLLLSRAGGDGGGSSKTIWDPGTRAPETANTRVRSVCPIRRLKTHANDTAGGSPSRRARSRRLLQLPGVRIRAESPPRRAGRHG